MRYEEPGERLHSHNWSKEYKDNYERVFGKKKSWLDKKQEDPPISLKISYKNGDLQNKSFVSRKEAYAYVKKYDKDIISWMHLDDPSLD